MKQASLLDLIVASKSDNSALLILMCRFELMLKKYARLLYYEDAYSDLQVELIVLFRSIDPMKFRNSSDGAVVNYVHRVIKNKYIYLSKAKNEYNRNIILFGEESDFEQLGNPASVSFDHYTEIDIKTLSGVLTENECYVINLFFYFGYSVGEIAGILCTSRQAVNKKKLSAIKKLRSSFYIDNL